MAEIVAGIGVPHTPHYPSTISRDGPEDTARIYREVKSHLDAVLPTFAIGVAEATAGPNDDTKMPRYDVTICLALARHMRDVGIARFLGYQDFGVDHAMLVPLHYLNHEMRTPILPIWVNTFVKPLPTARRCYALGNAMRSAIASMPEQLRVAVIGSGSFSLEIGGPRLNPGKRSAVPDIAWSKHVHALLKDGKIDDVLKEATPERMWQTGSIGGELLNWIVMLGVIGPSKPRYIAGHDNKDGHAYAVWRWD